MFKVFGKVYSQDRDQTADLLKGFAVLMMIQVHLMELFAKQDIYDGIIGRVALFFGGPPAAPIFMAVMGFFLSKSKKNFSQNMKRGLLLILGGILLNIGLNFHLLILIYLGKIPLNPLKYIFGVDILPLAGLSIILIALIKKVTRNNFYTSTFLAVIILIFILILHQVSANHRINDVSLIYIQAFLWGKLEWSYFPFLPWAVYPIIGFLYQRFTEKVEPKQSTKDFFASLSAVITFVSIKYGVDTASELSEYYHHDWLYALWVFQFLILMVFSLKRMELLCGKSMLLLYIKWLGKNVTAVYVFQWLIIGNIATAIFKTQNELELFIWFVVVIVLTTILIYAYEKRFGNKKSILFQS